MTTIKLTYKAFAHNASPTTQGVTTAQFELETADVLDNDIMDLIYKVTNLQDDLNEFGARKFEIDLWKTIKAILPANRTHTSLSVGDEIQIQHRTYEIANNGFKLLSIAGNGVSAVRVSLLQD